MAEKEFEYILEALSDLDDDSTVPKNVRIKVHDIRRILDENTEKSIRVNKALHELEEITDDINMQSHVRTILWNIASMLEKV